MYKIRITLFKYKIVTLALAYILAHFEKLGWKKKKKNLSSGPGSTKVIDAQVISFLWDLVSPKWENKEDGLNKLSISSQFQHPEIIKWSTEAKESKQGTVSKGNEYHLK